MSKSPSTRLAIADKNTILQRDLRDTLLWIVITMLIIAIAAVVTTFVL